MADIDDDHHLMRFVPYGQQQRCPDTDQFQGILNTAFSIRPRDKGGLSVTWIEHYGPKSAETVETAAVAFQGTLEKKKLPTKAYFAIGSAGATRETCVGHGKKIRLVHAPDGTNTGHVEIHRFDDEDRRLLDALAIEVYTQHVAVADMHLKTK